MSWLGVKYCRIFVTSHALRCQDKFSEGGKETYINYSYQVEKEFEDIAQELYYFVEAILTIGGDQDCKLERRDFM